MVERVLLHIGMHKTGSSALQSALQGYDDGSTFYARLPDPNHSVALYTAFAEKYLTYHIWRKRGDSAAFIEAKRADYRAALVAEVARTDRQRLILSGEDASLLGPAGAAALGAMLRNQGAEVRVMCYLRRPASFAASFVQQEIRGGRTALPDRVPTLFEKRLRPYVDLFGRDAVEVAVYDEITGGIASDFAQRFDLEAARLCDVPHNQSLSLPALRLMYLFNRTNPCNSGDPILNAARRDLIAHLELAYATTPRPDPMKIRDIADGTGLAYVFDTFGIDLGDGVAPTGDPAEAEAYLQDLSDVPLAPLIAVLDRYGIAGAHATPVAIVNRLYMQCVAEQTLVQGRAVAGR